MSEGIRPNGPLKGEEERRVTYFPFSHGFSTGWKWN
jgi:hypothetical protein